MLDDAQSADRGALTVVGVGITAIAQITVEVVDRIRRADAVFYHATTGVIASYLRELNVDTVDLYAFYGEGKRRRKTYIQMAERILREVRLNKRVTAVFHGHPGFFVMAARRALAIAESEGFETQMLPAVSSVDCLLADLRIDPGVLGLQILKAGSVLRGKATPASGGHVVLLQVGSVGDDSFSFTGYKNSTSKEFIRRLIEVYGEQHEAIFYLSPIFPGTEAVVENRKLGEYLISSDERFPSGILYLPPAGMSIAEVQRYQAFGKAEPYDEFAKCAIAELSDSNVPPDFKNRRCSQSLLALMKEIAVDCRALERFKKDPSGIFAQYPNLTESERESLRRRETDWLRSVSTQKV